ncbi:hypothetical protein [Desulfoferrobacter suflitae]|uniref:hypothetical protein n=1 Tax=Desulfoferrobacter suflitae TaxID=2865782 RepID=UPI002164D952|nr:hypothetical protein [Desulfoferrobacter suflitae]MCK8601049.1 hypothetical protein [Desulfoferrobacter suflitae]
MAKILDMKEMRQQLTAKRGFEEWTRRFAQTFDENTRLMDLDDATLAKLIQPGEESSMAIYEFIMGVKGLGTGTRFHFLENLDKMAIMDITLFFLDQLRFEAMRRLGWVEGTPNSSVPMVDLVAQFADRFSADKHRTPTLSSSHPRYKEYLQTFEGDRPSFIRRLIPEMLEIYKENPEEA